MVLIAAVPCHCLLLLFLTDKFFCYGRPFRYVNILKARSIVTAHCFIYIYTRKKTFPLYLRFSTMEP